MKYSTKLQATGGTLSTSIPKTIRDMLNVDKGDTIIWEVDISESGAIITLNKEEL